MPNDTNSYKTISNETRLLALNALYRERSEAKECVELPFYQQPELAMDLAYWTERLALLDAALDELEG